MPTAYPVARLIAGFLSGIGWVMISGAVVGFFMAPVTMGQQGVFGSFATMIILGVSLLALLFGLLYLCNSQSMRANLDSADYNREMLVLMRKTVPVETPRLPTDLPRTAA